MRFFGISLILALIAASAVFSQDFQRGETPGNNLRYLEETQQVAQAGVKEVPVAKTKKSKRAERKAERQANKEAKRLSRSKMKAAKKAKKAEKKAQKASKKAGARKQ